MFRSGDDKISVEYMVQAPNADSRMNVQSSQMNYSHVKGVFFLAHGCAHQGTDWFPKSTECPQCLELPIELNIVQTILSRGYIALSATSHNRDHKCWGRHDVEPIIHLISFIYNRYSLDFTSKPLFLLGASSGGSFVGMLSHVLMVNDKGFRASGIVPQIMNIMGGGMLMNPVFPPVAFVHMERDAYTSRVIRDEIMVLQSNRIPFKDFIVKPRPLSQEYFRSFVMLSYDDISTLLKAFRLNGIIDSERMITEDPRHNEMWRQVATQTLPHIFPSEDSLLPDASAVNELMNLAWAQHEIIPDHLPDIIAWFETLPNLNTSPRQRSATSRNKYKRRNSSP